MYLRLSLNVYRGSPFSRGNQGYERIRKLFCQFFVVDTDGTARRLGFFGNAGLGKMTKYFTTYACKEDISQLQSHPVNTDTEGVIESLRFNKGSV